MTKGLFMKTRPIRLAVLAFGLAGILCFCIGPVSTRGDVAVSVGVQINAVAEFHAPLAPHGVWVEVGSYGRCWRPAHVAVGWRPYCDGHWEWTDCGWYWVSDEPWAWACYHYGTWVYVSHEGWLWVPGIEWAPAWVYWRVGGGHIGWAPCAPHGVIVAPSLFVFVDGPRFHERIRPSTVIVNNTTIINKTTQITEIKRETRTIAGKPQKVVVNEGPGAEAVQKLTGKKFAAVPVQELDRKTSVPPSVRRRTFASTSRETAPTQEQKKSGPERKPEQPARVSPEEKPAKPDRSDKASPPDKPEQADREGQPNRRPSKDEAAPAPEYGRPESPSHGSHGPASGRERGRGKGKGPGA
jgi:hypothetical protein